MFENLHDATTAYNVLDARPETSSVTDFFAFEEQKAQILERITDGEQTSHMEQLACDALGHDRDTIEAALRDLERTELIRKNYDDLTVANNVIVRYELVHKIPTNNISISPVAHPAILKKLTNLTDRAYGTEAEQARNTYGDINSLDAVEWCLKEILSRAHEAITSGKQTVNFEEIRRYMIDCLCDESVQKWQPAYATAVQQATQLFEQHLDSNG